MQTDILIYTSQWCGYCFRAKQLLEAKNVSFNEISVDQNPEKRQEMMHKSGRFTVPQIWIGDQHVGGCDDLMALESAGKLDELLAKTAT